MIIKDERVVCRDVSYRRRICFHVPLWFIEFMYKVKILRNGMSHHCSIVINIHCPGLFKCKIKISLFFKLICFFLNTEDKSITFI